MKTWRRKLELSLHRWVWLDVKQPRGAWPHNAASSRGRLLLTCVMRLGNQVVKELRTEYSSAVGSTCQRLSSALAANPATSIYVVLSQAKAPPSAPATPMQQAAMIEALSSGLLSCLHELLGNLAGALDARVFVATGRGLWDFVGRDLLDFVQNLQVRWQLGGFHVWRIRCKPPTASKQHCDSTARSSFLSRGQSGGIDVVSVFVLFLCVLHQEDKEHKGAWRTRQNASLLLEHINKFFRSHLVQAIPHNLQEQDLAMPLHIDCTQKLLAGNTTALNQSFTPF